MSSEGRPSDRSSPILSGVTINDTELPPLPQIQSKQLSQRVFTRSVGHKDPFQALNGDGNADNEE
jgi:hypothetical protein